MSTVVAQRRGLNSAERRRKSRNSGYERRGVKRPALTLGLPPCFFLNFSSKRLSWRLLSSLLVNNVNNPPPETLFQTVPRLLHVSLRSAKWHTGSCT